jgi:hypothetical protein
MRGNASATPATIDCSNPPSLTFGTLSPSAAAHVPSPCSCPVSLYADTGSLPRRERARKPPAAIKTSGARRYADPYPHTPSLLWTATLSAGPRIARPRARRLCARSSAPSMRVIHQSRAVNHPTNETGYEDTLFRTLVPSHPVPSYRCPLSTPWPRSLRRWRRRRRPSTWRAPSRSGTPRRAGSGWWPWSRPSPAPRTPPSRTSRRTRTRRRRP